MDTISDRVRDLRTRSGLKGKELDRLAGFSPGKLWSIERAEGQNFELDTIRGLAGVFGCSLDYLVSGVGEPPTDEQLADAVKAARDALAAADSNNGGAAA